MRSSPITKVFSVLIIISLLLTALSACNRAGNTSHLGELAMGDVGSMPAEVKEAPTVVRQAYQFAVDNPDVLRQIPCYCGCDDLGHKSNYDCYIDSVDENGKVNFDSHALGCSICVDITQDVMRLLQEGKTLPEIHAAIDQTYSQYGPPTLP